MSKRKINVVDFSNPKILGFYLEQYKKEKLTRLKWFYDNIGMLQKSSMYNNASTSRTRELITEFKKEYEKLNNMKGPRIINNDSNISLRVSAIEPDPNIKKILYKSQSGHGRINFLNELRKMSPEKRFRRPETTNMEYGWNISKSDLGNRLGRVNIMKKTFFQRTGMTPDPDYYKKPIDSYVEAE